MQPWTPELFAHAITVACNMENDATWSSMWKIVRACMRRHADDLARRSNSPVRVLLTEFLRHTSPKHDEIFPLVGETRKRYDDANLEPIAFALEPYVGVEWSPASQVQHAMRASLVVTDKRGLRIDRRLVVTLVSADDCAPYYALCVNGNKTQWGDVTDMVTESGRATFAVWFSAHAPEATMCSIRFRYVSVGGFRPKVRFYEDLPRIEKEEKGSDDDDDDIECVRDTQICPITMHPTAFPVRGLQCDKSHLFFDVFAFIGQSRSQCPLCKRDIPLSELCRP